MENVAVQVDADSWNRMTRKNISFEQAKIYIDQLDLQYIIDSMCSDTYPLPRWTLDDAKKCSQLYKNFLLLHKKHLSVSLVPTREVDEFWHNHILYTEIYTKDCLNIFGHYLHHRPANPHDNPETLLNDYSNTKKLYLEEFKAEMNMINSLS